MAAKRFTGEIVCCILCGRDTPNKSHVCSHCYGGKRGSNQYERKARPSEARALRTKTVDANPLANAIDEDNDDMSNAERYHGGSGRDDI